MISAVAFCPQAPVVVPDVAQGAAGQLADLRAACRVAIRRLVAPGRQLVVLGSASGERDVVHESSVRGSFAGFGVDLDIALGSDTPGPLGLPPALTVGAWLLRDALGPGCGAVGVAASATGTAALPDGELGLLVMGDGSARRTVSAPGYLDDRAVGFDAAVAAALAGGDPAALVALDQQLAAQLLVAGSAAWWRTGQLLAGRHYDAELLHECAPYGVDYLVAAWTARE